MNPTVIGIKRALAGSLVDDIKGVFKSALANHTAESSYSQLGQDAFALALNGYKKGGYFVEFGATNGISLSNSFLLEKEFGWNGICAEPDRNWHNDLLANRTCHIETDCVWRATGETLSFRSAEQGELSTLEQFSANDHFAKERQKGSTYPVTTISLNDLLKKYDAPRQIDYMSVDTEGSEFEILQAFDFSVHRFGFISIEHNYTSARPKIIKLMQKNGYKQVFSSLSEFDAWFVPS